MIAFLSVALFLWLLFEISEIKKRLDRLERRPFETTAREARAAKEPPPRTAAQPEQAASPEESLNLLVEPAPYRDEQRTAPDSTFEEQRHEKKERPSRNDGQSLEQIISTRLGVWIGAAALIFGGLFLVKYSIEQGFFPPGLRLFMAALFGAGLIGGAEKLRRNAAVPNAPRITQALAGAGFAVLFGALYAAYALYHFLPNPVAFAGMAVLTGTAVVTGLRYGLPLSLLGIAGGLVTPLLVQSDAPALLPLFAYLFALSVAGLTVAQKRGWTVLSNVTLGGAVAWAYAMTAQDAFHGGAIVTFFGLPLLKMTAHLFAKASADEAKRPAQKSAVILPMAAFLVLLFFVPSGESNLAFWLALPGFALLGLWLERFNRTAFTPVLNPLLLALLALVWIKTGFSPAQTSGLDALEGLCLSLAAIALPFAASGLWNLYRRYPAPESQAWRVALASLGGYLIAYHRIIGLPPTMDFLPDFVRPTAYDLSDGPTLLHTLKSPFFWGAKALALASVHLLLAEATRRWVAPSEKKTVLAAFAFGASAFLTMALALVLPYELWGTAFSLQAVATLWIYSKTDVPVLPKIVGGLFALTVLINLRTGASDFWALLLFRNGEAQSLAHIATTYLLPAGALLGCALVDSRQDRPSPSPLGLTLSLIWGLLGAAALVTLVCAQLRLPLSFAPAGQTLLILTAAALASAKDQTSKAAQRVGTALLLLGLFRLIGFHLLMENPLLGGVEVGSSPLFGLGTLGYLLPLFPLHALARFRGWYEKAETALLSRAFLTGLFLTGGVIVLRHAFHGGPFLNGSVSSVQEQISYSALGLFTGTGLLALAMKLKDRTWRWMSLVLFLGTTGKVFLSDASHLTGLWRVLSFIALGFALLGLSAFYTKFVFKPETKE